MGLFTPQPNEIALQGAPERMGWTRELGTRRLVIGFVAVLAVWAIGSKIWDHYLLQKQWQPLAADASGLTVVGTLDGRTYDQNIFRIIQASEATRVELTDRGWRDIFDGRGGEVFSGDSGAAIRSALDVDSQAGYAMLTPFIRYGVERQMRALKPGEEPRLDEKIDYDEVNRTSVTHVSKTLGEMLQHYTGSGARTESGGDAEGESESGSGHSVDHGLAIPADVLIATCPVVLTGPQFTHAELETQPASILQGETYSVHLYLDPEGRSRFYQWSHDHADEDLVFVLKNRVLNAGRIKQTMDVNDWTVGPIRDKEAAMALVNYVNQKR